MITTRAPDGANKINGKNTQILSETRLGINLTNCAWKIIRSLTSTIINN